LVGRLAQGTVAGDCQTRQVGWLYAVEVDLAVEAGTGARATIDVHAVAVHVLKIVDQGCADGPLPAYHEVRVAVLACTGAFVGSVDYAAPEQIRAITSGAVT
jgi:hypothetical protein